MRLSRCKHDFGVIIVTVDVIVSFAIQVGTKSYLTKYDILANQAGFIALCRDPDAPYLNFYD